MIEGGMLSPRGAEEPILRISPRERRELKERHDRIKKGKKPGRLMLPKRKDCRQKRSQRKALILEKELAKQRESGIAIEDLWEKKRRDEGMAEDSFPRRGVEIGPKKGELSKEID